MSDLSQITIDSFAGTLNELISANVHSRGKGNAFKKWCTDNFELDSRIAYIKSQQQLTNRVSEQFRYFSPIVVFVCNPDVKRDTLLKYIFERGYKQLRAIAIVGVSISGEGEAAKSTFEYEQLLVAQRMPQMIEDSLVHAFYETHKSQLSLREMILKGALVVIPNGAPNVAELKRNLQHLDDAESLEWIEKYVYQYGVGYELFVEDWKLQEEVLDYIPLEEQELEKLLRKNRQVEVQDSINTYLLEVMDYHLAGSVMPLEYARKDIEKNILGARRVDFLEDARNELYDKSLKNGKLVRYEK